VVDRPQSNPAPDDGSRRPGERTWVPIRSLAPRHRQRIEAHLLKLSERDRYLRFGHPATDAQIRKYVDLLDFDRDEIFGIFNRKLELIAMAHLAFGPASEDPAQRTAEFGVSVLDGARGRGFGHRLFEHAMLHARNRSVRILIIYALSENTAMLRIARAAGAQIEREGSESQAHLKLPEGNLGTHLDAIVADSAAELDYRLKVQGKTFAKVLDVISEVRAQIGANAHLGGE
jgi:GNAT superfamily N-acetyltransferase